LVCELVQDHQEPAPEVFEMAARPPFIKGAARLGLAVLVVLLAVAPDPALAASRFQFNHSGNGNGNSANGSIPYNVDQDPCMAQMSGRRRQGENCPGDATAFPQGNRGARHPGPTAFGLQFDNGSN
jgi:hypothetical protein